MYFNGMEIILIFNKLDMRVGVWNISKYWITIIKSE